MEQVLITLLDNALNYTPPHSPVRKLLELKPLL